MIQNIDVRSLVYDSGIHYKEIAHEIGIGDKYLSRLMRKPLSDKMKKRIIEAIEALKQENVEEPTEKVKISVRFTVEKNIAEYLDSLPSVSREKYIKELLEKDVKSHMKEVEP